MNDEDRPVASPPSISEEDKVSDPLAPERMDALTYKLVALGFILLTLVIITGAAWAQYTWHKWWSWDPKETSALVAWLVYLLYLHGRLLGWSKRLLAWIAVVGAFAVLFCYAGVNLLGGLHAYGAPTQSLAEGARHAFEGMRSLEATLAKGFLACYLAAFVLYLGAAVLGSSAGENPEGAQVRRARLVWIGVVPTLAGFVLHTIALVDRSLEAGHLPFSSGYEYAASFAWAIVVVFLVLQFQVRTPLIGAVSIPLVLLVLAYGFLWFGDKGVSPLPVALQNKFWLHLHVAIAVISYAALILATATSAIYLARTRRSRAAAEA